MKLVIGNKNYSTWSLRPWLLMTHFSVNFTEQLESLAPEKLSERLAQYSDSKKVPVLINKELSVWDSLAICEYVNEQCLAGRGWPKDPAQRAIARSVSAQMHSGFGAIRNEMPMNIRAKRRVELSEEAKNEINQMQLLWHRLLQNSGGPWLFGEFSIADCMYIPVILRFETYGISLLPSTMQYRDTVFTNEAVKQWVDSALQETEVVVVDEAGEER
ncbi:MAG: glutathione S-transferase family protein [Psychrobium sp.]